MTNLRFHVHAFEDAPHVIVDVLNRFPEFSVDLDWTGGTFVYGDKLYLVKINRQLEYQVYECMRQETHVHMHPAVPKD